MEENIQQNPTEADKSPKSGKLLAIGCASLVLLLILGGVILHFSWRGIVSRNFRSVIEASLEKSHLPEEDRERLLASVDRVLQRFVHDDLGPEEFRKLMESVGESPLARVFIILSVKAHYLPKTELSSEEKLGAENNINRLIRGVLEKKITDQELLVFQEFFPNNDSGKMDYNAELPDERCRELLVEIKELVQAKQIPDEEYVVPVADELEILIEAAIGGPNSEPPKDPNSEVRHP